MHISKLQGKRWQGLCTVAELKINVLFLVNHWTPQTFASQQTLPSRNPSPEKTLFNLARRGLAITFLPMLHYIHIGI